MSENKGQFDPSDPRPDAKPEGNATNPVEDAPRPREAVEDDAGDRVLHPDDIDDMLGEDPVAALQAENAKLKDDYLRALAEVENIRRRANREKADAGKYAVANFARDMLSVADNLQRALVSVDDAMRDENATLETFVSGVELTFKELQTALERVGVKRIEALGQRFDPHVHEAMYEIPDETVTAGTVMQVLQDGYTIHDRTLRPARVGVSKGGPKPGTEATADADQDAAPSAAQGSANPYEKHADATSGGAPGANLDEKL